MSGPGFGWSEIGFVVVLGEVGVVVIAAAELEEIVLQWLVVLLR